MKKSLYFVLFAFFTIIIVSCSDDGTSSAPENIEFVIPDTVDTENSLDVRYKYMALINKMTATWCGPCGQFGWDMFHNIIHENHGKAVFMGTYAASNSMLYIQTARDFYSAFNGKGYPSMCWNGDNVTVYSNEGGIYPSYTEDTTRNKTSRLFVTAPPAGASYLTSLNGSTLTIKTRTKFFDAVSGDYYLGIYMVENKVLETQTGQTGQVEHSYVLRGTVTEDSWGIPLISGDVKKYKTIDEELEFEIPAGWNTDNLSIALVIWNKVGNDYKYVNAYTRYKL